ncbi:hypothetical protein RN001_013378 [Aquatica leii]|uniref:Cytochrome P450 n=1 Tax=Aquatica leii TaxID=1421715 RepID=A0AAN7SLK7_9COLE|nr:hypothetical protein RN001_013378 [Aquatica leii]
MLLLIACVIILIVLYLTVKPLFYWPRKGVKQKNPFLLWIDNVRIIFQTVSAAELTSKVHNSFGNERYIGTCHYFQPLLFLRDPDLIKQLTVKDFEYFIDHSTFVADELDPLWTRNLLSLKGDDWKDMRATLSPSFTSSKMRAMFGLINECADNFVEFFKKDYHETIDVDLKDVFTRCTNDVIASTAFGVTCNSLVDRNNEFYLMGKEATNFSGIWRNFSFIIMFTFPKLADYFNIRMFSKPVNTFFTQLIKNNIEYREENGIVRPDMIHLLMEAQKGRLKHEEVKDQEIDTGFATIEESSIGKEDRPQKRNLTDDDITAQALIFFLAGSDSSSTLMCFAVYELTMNPDIQKRLQDEIDETLQQCEGDVTYEALLKMKYLDMVLSETLRKWPNTTTVDRACVKPYTIQPIHPEEQPVHLNKGDLLWIPMFALHRDPKFYPQPEKFNPERFNDENKANIRPYTYLPFGSGPRSCIGNRFALLEAKLIIFKLLANFDFIVIKKTARLLKISKKQFNLNSEQGFHVGFRLRKLKSQ